MIAYRPRTLLWQLGFALMALQATAVVFLSWYAWSQFAQFSREQTANELQRALQLVIARYGDVARTDTSVDLDTRLDALTKQDGVATASPTVW
jgi:hypothetical protein